MKFAKSAICPALLASSMSYAKPTGGVTETRAQEMARESGRFIARYIEASMRQQPIKDFDGHCFALEGRILKECRRQVLQDFMSEEM